MDQPTISPVSGGCIARVERLRWRSGQQQVRKTYDRAALAQAELAGLKALHAAPGPPVPEVLDQQGAVLYLADLGQGRASQQAWTSFAKELATLHRQQGPGFGFACPTYCGLTKQDNTWHSDGHEFMISQRLLPMAIACFERGVIEKALVADINAIAAGLRGWLSVRPPVLLHGDLWSGNVHAAADGRIYLIDPACWYGWAECDLALAELFGGFPALFWDVYRAHSDLSPEWSQRLRLHQLWHLMNHALLFAGSYGGQAKSMAAAWLAEHRG